MKILFFALCFTVIIAIAFLFFAIPHKFQKKLHKYIFKYILTGVAIFFLVFIAILLLTLGFKLFLAFIFMCLGLSLLGVTILFIINEGFDGGLIFLIFFGLALSIPFSIYVLTANFDKTSKELTKEEVILTDYCKEKAIDEKVTLIELGDFLDAKSYIIQTYTSDIEFPTSGNYIDEYKLQNSGENKIVVTTTQTSGTDLLVLFGFKDVDISESKSYTLYVNPDDILYN